MSLKLKKLARKFILILGTVDEELLNDPLYHVDPKNPDTGYFNFETTEEMDEIIQGILIALLEVRREFDKILVEKKPRSPAGVSAAYILNTLDLIEEFLLDEKAFTTSYRGSGLLNFMEAVHIIERLKDDLLKYSSEGKLEFNKSVIHILTEVDHKFHELEKLCREQTSNLSPNKLLVTREDKDVDSISKEDLHVDFQYEEAEESEEDLEMGEPQQLLQYERQPDSIPSSDVDYDGWAKPGKTFHAR
jgi:hypothetical protein